MTAKKEEILSFIRAEVRCFDGAMGSMLFKQGIQPGSCPELSAPEIIKSIHRQYVEAGAQFVTTNTFGANRLKLAKFNLEDKVLEINKRNTILAREAAPEVSYYVVGDIGPTGEFIEPFGNCSFEQFYDVFSEQVEALVIGGADALIIETMSSLEEVQAAIKAAKENSDLLVIACMTFNKTPLGFRTLTGVTVPAAVNCMLESGADVIGSNCSLVPAEMAGLIKEFRSQTEQLLIAQPNAGQPKLVNGLTVYELGPDVEKHLTNIIKNGANIVGGCCGTDPDYIRLLRRIIDLHNQQHCY